MGPANENDREGIKVALDNMSKRYGTITKMWADMGYQSESLKDYIKQNYDISFEIVKRPPCRFWLLKDTPPELLPKVEVGFKVQPKRWIVERTFAWINRNRRLSKEYDPLAVTSENFIALAMTRLLLHRMYA